MLSACATLSTQPAPIGLEPVEAEPANTINPTIELEPSITPTSLQIDPGTPISPDKALEGNRPLAARVNDQPVFLDSYEKLVTQIEQALQAQGIDLSREEGQLALAEAQQQALEGLIDQSIIEQQAAKLNIAVPEVMLEARVRESVAQKSNQVNFEEWLAANDLTLEEFKNTLRSQLLSAQLFEEVTANLPETAVQIQLQYIRVTDLNLAWDIIEQLKSGDNFISLVREYSLDTDRQTDDEPLEWFPKGLNRFPKTVEQIAFSLQPGQVSGPIETRQGFYIIRLQNREEQRLLTNEMRQILKKQIFTTWLMEQRAAAEIEKFIAP